MSANVPPLKYAQNENDETSSLLVRDVSQYLLMLAKMNANPNTGNALLSEALSAITKALKPYSTCHASELPRILNHVKSDNSYSPSSRKEKISLPKNLETLSLEHAERILKEKRYTKLQLIELGTNRFGVSRSKLAKTIRSDIVAVLGSAIEHERTLKIISKEARRDGSNRSS